MSSIFPLRETVSLDDREPRLVDLDEETADDVFEALASGTTRTIFLELHNTPQTASDLATVTDTSVQNIQYHLEKLLDADLVEVVDTWYSERGSEMKVYAPTDESLVLFAGRDKQNSLRKLMQRVLGVMGVLIPSSALVGLGTHWHYGDSAAGDTESEGVAADTDGDEEDAEPAEFTAETDDEFDTAAESQEDVDVALDSEATDVPEDGAGIHNTTGDGNETVEGMTDGGSEEFINTTPEAVDTAAAIDPFFAGGLFLLGGLVVFLAITLWYGNF